MAADATVRLDALAPLEPSSLPTEFRLFAFGDNPTSKGTFKLDAAGAESVMAAYQKHGVELHIDWEHDMRNAAAWFVPEVRADGLYAVNVRWTPKAAAEVRNREYRYFSPTFATDASKRITRLVNVALTNLPATEKQPALVAAKDGGAGGGGGAIVVLGRSKQTTTKENYMGLAILVGLKDDASEDDVQERVAALVDNERKLLEQTGKASMGEAFAEFIAAGVAVKERDEMRARLTEWEQKAARDEQVAKERQIESLVAGAIADGRVASTNEDLIAKLKKQGEDFGVESLKFAIGLIPKRPARVFQTGPVADPFKAQMAAIDGYKREHEGASTADAVMALTISHPALFAATEKE